MTANGNWLERLGLATDYQELRTIFSELVAESSVTTDGAKLAEAIDEAIRRIEQERARDQGQLASYEQEYDAFKSQQSGVTGWFKRHLPFTETRRVDRQHRETVADQHAEILANHLFIARAQMLKQELLPFQSRQLGRQPDQWRTAFGECDSIAGIDRFGKLLLSLSQELIVSEQFTGAVRDEIQSFRDAEFASEEAQKNQKNDVVAATNELKTLESEIKDERSLLEISIQRAGKLVSEELSLHDTHYYGLLQRTSQLRKSSDLAKESADVANSLTEMLATLGTLSDQADKIQSDQTNLIARRESMQHDLQLSRSRFAQAEHELAAVTVHHDQAKRDADQAEASFNAAHGIYEQHLAATANDATGPSTSSNPVFIEYQRLDREKAAAKDVFRMTVGPFETAKSHHEEVKRKNDKLESDLRSADLENAELNRKHQETIAKLEALRDKIPMAIGQYEPLLGKYLGSLESLEWESHVMALNRSLKWKDAIDPSFEAPRSTSIRRETSTRSNAQETEKLFRNVTDAIKKDMQELQQRLDRDEQEQRTLWIRRCQELLGGEVAKLVCRT